MSQYLWFGFSDTYMPLLAFLVYLCLYKKIRWQEADMAFYCLFSFLLFAITNVMVVQNINNLFLYHFYSLFEVAFLGYYILKLIYGSKFIKPWLLVSSGYLVYWILNIIYIEPIESFNMISSGIANLVVLFLCMVYLLGLSTRDEILYFQRMPSFWIVSGFLIFSALSLMVFITYDNFNDSQQANLFWTVVISIATFCKFVLISVGFLCYRRSPSSPHPR